MKVKHIITQETFDLSEPKYAKFNSEYGYLVGSNDKVFFITCGNGEVFSENVTNSFVN